MKSKFETAKAMAQSHFRVEPELKRVFLLTSNTEEDDLEPIKLLEVVEGTLETDFEPIAFPANPGRGVPYPSVILEISPRQFSKVEEERELRINGATWKLATELHAA